MGLDMYLFAEKNGVNAETGRANAEQIAYWRKHNALHHWFDQLYREKHGESAPEFNCENVYLTTNDLDRLEADIKEARLTPTSGFFFGSTDYDPSEEMEADLAAVAKARAEIAAGHPVFYTSWW